MEKTKKEKKTDKKAKVEKGKKIKKTNILITGGAGFIGGHLADRLTSLGYNVIIVDIVQKENTNIYINPLCKYYCLNIHSEEMDKLFKDEKIDYVFHLAAQIDVRISTENPIFDNKENLIGSYEIIEKCWKHKIKKIIFPSTAGVYGDKAPIPTKEKVKLHSSTPYSDHKLGVEHHLSGCYRERNLKYCVLRMSNVYGPRQFRKNSTAGALSIFSYRMLNKQKIKINGNGKQTRDYIYINDVIDAMVAAMNSQYVGVINIGTGKETSLNDAISIIKKILKTDVVIGYEKAKKGEQLRSCLNITKASKILGWSPKTSLKEGLKKLIISLL